ncbi:MAG: hypothetical protein H0V70_30395 [Ktedonobacteraceae bacterium]|jgi:hypothetical protein|nr:hypothetical protein [Ktedonobacteraceae bacterium]
MSLDTQLPEGHTGRFTSPDLKLRDSKTMWGPLQISIHCHRQSAELGYQAGEEAYQEVVRRFGQGTISADTLERFMTCYLTTPRYRPRIITEKIVAEWKALFVLGWSNQLLQDLTHRDTDDLTNTHL